MKIDVRQIMRIIIPSFVCILTLGCSDTGGDGDGTMGTTDSGSTTSTGENGQTTGATATGSSDSGTQDTGTASNDGTSGDTADTDTGGTDTSTGGADEGPNLAFVTSKAWAPQDLGGLAGADAKCQSLADDAGLEGTFVAWLSDSTTDAKDRLPGARGWVRLDGRPVADTVDELVASNYWYAPHLDETGTRQHGDVVTGTAADGTASASYGDFCQDFTGSNETYGAVHGHTDVWGDGWTTFGAMYVGALQPCDVPARLWCFQIDHADPVQPDFPPSRKVFVSKGTPKQSEGLESMDAVCQSEASDNDLEGTFVAFVGTNDASALSRLNTAGEPWARLGDDLPIVDDASDLADGGPLLAPIVDLADGGTIGDTAGSDPIYSGASTPSTTGTDAETCDNWTAGTSASTFRNGVAGFSDTRWWDEDRAELPECNTWRHVYCFEQ